MRVVLLLVAALAVAGCGQPNRAVSPLLDAIEGVVTDHALLPIAGADVSSGNQSTTTDAEGRFRLSVAGPSAVVITARAPGFLAASVSTGPGETGLRIRLERLPLADAYTTVETYSGFLQCAVVTIVEGGEPHEWTGLRCSQLLPDERNHWILEIPANVGGMVIELEWEASTSFANTMVLRVVVAETGEPLGLHEGLSLVRVQPAIENLRRAVAAGTPDLLVTVDAGAGDTEQEEGSVGVFVTQAFTLYATSFFNQPADPAYTIADSG